METLLKQKLAQVASRFQNGRFAMWLIVFWGMLLATVVIAYTQGYRTQNPVTLGISLILLTSILWLIAFILSRSSFRNERWIAQQIEARYQTLEQRLITILEKPIDESNTASLFFRRELLKETLDHAETHDWRDAMPSAWFNQLWFVQSVLLFLFLYLSTTLILPSSIQSPLDNTLVNNSASTTVLVEPGNSEVEKGSNVVFTARFNGPVPADVALEYTTDANPEKMSQTLRRNLKDPVFGGVLLGVETPITYRVAYNAGVSEEFRIKIFEFPKVVRSDAKISSPTYAPAPDKIIEDTRRVTVAEGSQLTWSLHLNKPVASVELIDKSGNKFPLASETDNPTLYSLTLTLRESTTWKVHLVDTEGRKNKFPEELIAKVLPNKPPTIKLVKASDRRVSPLEEMDIGAKLNDDFGISKVGLAYSINGNEPTEILLTNSDEVSKKLEASHLLALEQLKAKPDQLISYYVWAEDKDSDGNLRRVESDLFFAEVRPFEEIYREGDSPSENQQQQQQQQQSGAQQQAEEAAEMQRQIIVAIWNVLRRETGDTHTEKFDSDLQVIVESQTSVIEKLAEIQERANAPDASEIVTQIEGHMKRVIDLLTEARDKAELPPVQKARAAAQSALAGLLQLRAREHEIVRSRQQQQQSQSQSRAQQSRQQQLNELELNNDPNRYESQQSPPQPEEEQQAQEVRQAVNRLKELAQRQEDLNEELQKLQAEIEAAQTEEEKQALQEQLDRLRDAQEELLRDADELKERMNEANENEAMEQARERMEQARENVRQAAESLAQNDPNEALSAGTRAEREFEEMRDELRQQSANQFSERMKDMVEQARDLSDKQKQLNKQASSNPKPEDNTSLRSESADSQLPQELKDQSQKLTNLLDKMQQTVTEAETSEPLLADKLYDSFRETKQQNIEENLNQLSRLAEQGVEVGREPETQRFLDQATLGIDRLQQQIESAANSVLGSEEESLRRALRELSEAADDVNQELRNATGREGEDSGTKPNFGEQSRPADQPGNQEQPNLQLPNSGQSENPADENSEQTESGNQQRGEGRQTNQDQQTSPREQPNQAQPQSAGQPQADNPPQAEGQTQGEGQTRAEGQPQSESQQQGEGQPQGDGEPQGEGEPQRGRSQNRSDQAREGRARSGLNNLLEQMGGANTSAPISGNDFLEFSDRLRDVEEILDDPELQSQVARVREAARDIRREARKHAADPQWALVERLVANPLRDLRVKLQEELLRKTAEKNSLVPIDRDPVPSEFEKAQQKYYENLGSGKR